MACLLLKLVSLWQNNPNYFTPFRVRNPYRIYRAEVDKRFDQKESQVLVYNYLRYTLASKN